MKAFYQGVASFYFLVATVALMAFACVLLVVAVVEVAVALRTQKVADAALDGVGLLIIGFAVIETAKFIAEEELLRKRELRSPRESRLSLTKFVTIIVIAGSLEALVMVFKAQRSEVFETLYASALLLTSMLALVALGAYQWLSSRVDTTTTEEEVPDRQD